MGHVGDVELQVVEMIGEPGDAYFMDLRVLHTYAHNRVRYHALCSPNVIYWNRHGLRLIENKFAQ